MGKNSAGRLGWQEFSQVAYPPELRAKEDGASVVFRIHRWFGIRFAFPLYRLGFSGNDVSAVRVGIAAAGIGLLGTTVTGSTLLPMVGVFLLALQVNLDASDGAIARVNRSKGPVGSLMDGAGNAFARGAVLALLGYLTGSLGWFVAGILAFYLSTDLVPGLGKALAGSEHGKPLPLPLRLPSSVVMMAFALPAAIATLAWFEVDLDIFARAVVAAYLAIGVIASMMLLRAPGANPGAAR